MKKIIINRLKLTYPRRGSKYLGMGIVEKELEKRFVYFCPNENEYQMISRGRDKILTLPVERLLKTNTQEIFFRLFRHREWYIRKKGRSYEAKWSP